MSAYMPGCGCWPAEPMVPCSLHAAAPRMLEALKEVSACYAEIDAGRQWAATRLETAIHQARAILRDVEGESNG